MSIFPGAIPTFTGFTASHTLAADSHASQHNSEQAEIAAIATKVGTGSSTPTSGALLRGTGAGTSSWGQAVLTTDVTGTLPAANGGTGQNSLTSLPLASPVMTGGGSWAGSPTITTPVIADFSNATHTHQNNAGGGLLSAAALPNLVLSTQSLSNPYKFAVYRNGALTVNTGALRLVTFETEDYDTNNNFDAVTNNSYAAPVNGFYNFAAVCTWSATASHTRMVMSLFVNGSEHSRLGDVPNISATAGSAVGSRDIQLTAGDTVDIRVQPVGANVALLVGTAPRAVIFTGHLIAQT